MPSFAPPRFAARAGLAVANLIYSAITSFDGYVTAFTLPGIP
jgi:hypothetical protein